MPALTQKSQVTIPKSIRKVLGIGPGDEVEFHLEHHTVILHKKKKLGAIERYRGLLGRRKTAEVMAELR